jgi:membrane associated rhomboid family serine protease
MPSGTNLDEPSSGQAVSDGLMDFAQYSDAQLQDLRLVLDNQRYPLNALHLQQELDRRAALSLATHEPTDSAAVVRYSSSGREAGAGGDTYPVRFSAHEGWRGWLSAKRRLQPYFASGTVILETDEVVLAGWCRSWLGISERGEQRIALQSIRNVARSDSLVSFECRRPWRWRRRLCFQCESAAAAARLVGALPSGRTTGFELKWQALQDFSRRLDARGVRPWVTQALVGLNVLVFALIVTVNRAWTGVSWQTYISWGANFGPLTTQGQWWRLLTSVFLHGGLWHLLVNMWVLWNAGRLTERLYGNGRYAFIWFASALAASMTSVVWDPTQVSIGASGAIFGVLGAFIAHAIKPSTRLPKRILAVHWVSTAVFALFSLANGWFSPGIDNAAHAGGLLMGVVLGLLLSQSLPQAPGVVAAPEHPATDSPAAGGAHWLPLAVAALCTVAYLGLGYVQIRGVGTQPTAPTSYLNAHRGFAIGEEKNLLRWSEIGGKFDAGLISPAETAREFQSEVLPFWVGVQASMTAELPHLPLEQQPYAKDLLAYVKVRRDWASVVIQEAAAGGALSRDVMQAHLADTIKALARLERRRMDADAGLAPRALVRTPTAIRLSHLFRSTPPCVDPPAWTGGMVGAKDNPADGPARRRVIRCDAQRAFLAQNFGELESLWHRYPADDTDPVDGETRHGSALLGLDDLFQYGSMPVGDGLAALANWRKQYPQSVMPELVEVSLFHDWAWSARGHGFAKDISAQQWQLFNTRSIMASAALEDAQARGAGDPEWYVLRLDVGLDLSEDKEAMTGLFNTAIARYPHYLPLIRTRLRALMPRWGGSYEDVEKLITWVAARRSNEWSGYVAALQTSNEEPTYARLYAAYASLEGDETDFYGAGKMRWPEVQEGFDELLTQYPHSDVLLNEFVYLACREGDSPVYGLLRRKLEGRVVSGLWLGQHTLASCDKSML